MFTKIVKLFRSIKLSNFFRQGQNVRREQKSSEPARPINRSSNQILQCQIPFKEILHSPIPMEENLQSHFQTFQKLPPQLPVKDEPKISTRSLQDIQNEEGEPPPSSKHRGLMI